ncbi:MAG: hypothetical protein IIV99_03850 [Oscillospiraceae bacterium]|nr:hypothetical protein [Oscillospiraceae bacterium]
MDHAIKLAKEYITANRRLYRADIKVTKTMIEDAQKKRTEFEEYCDKYRLNAEHIKDEAVGQLRPKPVNGDNRAELLVTFTRRKFSPSTELAISETFVPLPEEAREAHAQKILDIINSTESEEEILQKIKNLHR